VAPVHDGVGHKVGAHAETKQGEKKMKQFNDNWSYDYVVVEGYSKIPVRVYTHKDGYKLTKRRSFWVMLNGNFKGQHLTNATLRQAMVWVEKYGLISRKDLESREDARFVIKDELDKLSLEVQRVVKTLIIQDGMEAFEAIECAKNLYALEEVN